MLQYATLGYPPHLMNVSGVALIGGGGASIQSITASIPVPNETPHEGPALPGNPPGYAMNCDLCHSQGFHARRSMVH